LFYFLLRLGVITRGFLPSCSFSNHWQRHFSGHRAAISWPYQWIIPGNLAENKNVTKISDCSLIEPFAFFVVIFGTGFFVFPSHHSAFLLLFCDCRLVIMTFHTASKWVSLIDRPMPNNHPFEENDLENSLGFR